MRGSNLVIGGWSIAPGGFHALFSTTFVLPLERQTPSASRRYRVEKHEAAKAIMN